MNDAQKEAQINELKKLAREYGGIVIDTRTTVERRFSLSRAIRNRAVFVVTAMVNLVVSLITICTLGMIPLAPIPGDVIYNRLLVDEWIEVVK